MFDAKIEEAELSYLRFPCLRFARVELSSCSEDAATGQYGTKGEVRLGDLAFFDLCWEEWRTQPSHADADAWLLPINRIGTSISLRGPVIDCACYDTGNGPHQREPERAERRSHLHQGAAQESRQSQVPT